MNATLIRIPVGWNYLQPVDGFPKKSLDANILRHLDLLVEHATSNKTRQVYVVVDLVSSIGTPNRVLH